MRGLAGAAYGGGIPEPHQKFTLGAIRKIRIRAGRFASVRSRIRVPILKGPDDSSEKRNALCLRTRRNYGITRGGFREVVIE